MNLRVSVAGEVKGEYARSRSESEAEEGAVSQRRGTRNQVIYPWAGGRTGDSVWRSEPVSVEKLSDDLWVGVKGQSNLEIARTPRNVFRCSLGREWRR